MTQISSLFCWWLCRLRYILSVCRELHINDTQRCVYGHVEDISDAHIPSDVKIGWSEDCLKCVLLINGYPHGVFDFEGKNGYCRSGFPPPVNREWSVQGHAWDDYVDNFFRWLNRKIISWSGAGLSAGAGFVGGMTDNVFFGCTREYSDCDAATASAGFLNGVTSLHVNDNHYH